MGTITNGRGQTYKASGVVLSVLFVLCLLALSVMTGITQPNINGFTLASIGGILVGAIWAIALLNHSLYAPTYSRNRRS